MNIALPSARIVSTERGLDDGLGRYADSFAKDGENTMDEQPPHATSDEIAVKAAVERLLAAMGTYDLEAEIDPAHYTEPVTEFTVHVDRGRLAFVRADATVFVDDQAIRHNFDYFTLINENGIWKFVNASYVGTPAPPG